MADRKITELGAIDGASIADNDLYTIVDVSEVDPGLKNKKFTLSSSREYYNFYYLAITGGTVSGDLTVTGDLSVGGSTGLYPGEAGGDSRAPSLTKNALWAGARR